MQKKMTVSTGKGSIDHLSKNSFKDQIKEYICTEISSGRLKANNKIPTQRTLAAMFDVSRKICEVAMHELELNNLIFRRPGKGSFVLENNSRKVLRVKSHTVAVSVPNINNDLTSSLVSLLEKELFNFGINTIVSRSVCSAGEGKKYIKMFKEKNVDGIIGFTLSSLVLDYAMGNDIPVINISPAHTPATNNIIIDLEKAGRLVTEHLIGLGHEKILCAGSFPVGNKNSIDPRFKAVIDVMKRSKLPAEDIIIPQSSRATINPDYEKWGYELAEKILARKEPFSAIVFYNDHRALGAMKAFQERGFKIPEDFSIAGFDNAPMSRVFYPSLTSVDFNIGHAVRKAVKYLLDKQEGQTIYLEPELIKRASTGRLKHK